MRLQIFFLVVFFAIFCEYHCKSSESATPGWDYGKNYEIDDKSSDDNDKKGNKTGYNYDSNDPYDDDPSNNDDNDSSEYPLTRRRKSPDEYGNINLYFPSPSKGGKKKKTQKMRFPVHRFDRKRAPRFSPLLSFLPWLPIFADRLTKQTIIYSPTGGIYIIPPVINFYGQLFSIAELIASGYCSLVSSGAPPPPAVNVAPLVQPGAVAGPGIPPANTVTGGFKGGVRTEFRSFARPRYPSAVEEEEGEEKTITKGRSRGSKGSSGY